MEHEPTDTSIGSETPEKGVPAHETPPGALAALGENQPFWVWQLGGVVGTAATRFRGVVGTAATRFGGVVTARASALRHGALAGHLAGDGDALMIWRIQTEAERLQVKGEAGEGSGNGVEGALVEGEGLQARVGMWGGEMEERVTEAARSIQERGRAKDELVELGKEHELLQAETERLRLQFVEAVNQAQSGAGDWLPLWRTANGILQQLDSTRAEGERVGAKVKAASNHLTRTEQETEKLMLELGRVMGGDRESVAGVGAPGAAVQAEDAMVEPKSEEAAREFARD